MDQLFPYKCTSPNGDERSEVGWREFGGRGELRETGPGESAVLSTTEKNYIKHDPVFF